MCFMVLRKIDENQWLKDYKLSSREIDVLACMLENQASKKISQILDIKQKTADTHITHIMQKMSKNSRTNVIEFVKNSPNSGIIHQHYFDLIEAFEFKKALQKIKQNVKSHDIACKIMCQDNELRQRIESDLKLLNIHCFSRKKGAINIRIQTGNSYYMIFFHVLLQLVPDPFIEKILAEFNLRFSNCDKDTSSNVIPIQKVILPNYRINIILWLFMVGIASLLIFSLFKFDCFIQKPAVCSTLDLITETKILKRQKILEKIHDAFRKNKSDIKIVTLVGISGIGKTTIAHQYAMTQHFPVVWEIQADNQTSILESFANLAYALSETREEKTELNYIKQEENQRKYESKLMFFIKRKLKQYKNWFLIFDNVDSLGTIYTFLPTSKATWGQGRVLITTKNNRIANHEFIQEEYVIEIPELKTSEMLELFLKIQGQTINNLNSTKIFLEKIPPFPLDVFTAAYYIKNTNSSYEEYLNLLDTNQANASYFQEIDYNGKIRYQIVANTVDQILKKHKEFLPLLLLVSLLNHRDISLDFLKKYHDAKTVNIFVQQMCHSSLLSSHTDKISEKTTLAIHQSVQQVILQYLIGQFGIKKQEAYIDQLVGSFCDYVNHNIFALNNSKEIPFFLMHLLSIYKHKIIPESCKWKLNLLIGKIYFLVGDYPKSYQFLEKNSTFPKAVIPEYDLYFYISGLVYFGAVLDELMDHDKAQEMLEKCIDLYQKKHTSDREEGLALVRLYLGKVYSQKGEYLKAQKVLKESIQFWTNQNKNKKNFLTKAITLLAESYMYSGEYEESRYWFNKNSNLLNQIDKNNPQILWNNLRLGRLYIFTGQYLKAKNIFETGIASLNKQLPKDKDKIAWSMIYLGEIYRLLGLYEQSRHSILEGIEIFKQLYGVNHILTEWCSAYLGRLYCDIHRDQNAYTLLQQSLIAHQKHYKQHRKRYVFILQALANTFIHLRNFQQAEILLKDCLHVCEKQFGTQHSEYAIILRDYGYLCVFKKDYIQAEKYLNQSLNILEKKQHAESYRCLEYLGDLYQKRSRDKQNALECEQYEIKARTFYKEALARAKIFLVRRSEHITRITNQLKSIIIS